MLLMCSSINTQAIYIFKFKKIEFDVDCLYYIPYI